MGSGLLELNLSVWIFQAVAMAATCFVLPKLRVTSVFGPFLMVVGLALVNAKLWDAALFFHIPDSLSYHAMLLLVTNGLIFWLLVKLLPGIEVNGLLPALVAPVLFTVFSLLIDQYGRDIDWSDLLSRAGDWLEATKTYFQTGVENGAPGPVGE